MEAMKLLPVKATKEMLYAAMDALDTPFYDDLERAYEAMVKAAPEGAGEAVAEILTRAGQHVALAKSMGNFGVASKLVAELASSLSSRAEAAESQASSLKQQLDEARQGHADARDNFLTMQGAANKLRIRAEKMADALEPFAWIGQWLFARNLPDDTPIVSIEGIGKPLALTRGMFKAAHTARRALEATTPTNGDSHGS